MSADRSTILLVDADERSRQLIELSLTKAGHTVTAVSGTLDALVALHGGAFDLIVSEVALSDGDGFELLEQCKLDPTTAKVPFAMLTADPDADSARATEAGADEVIAKPIRIKAVMETLGAMLAGVARPSEPPPLPTDAVFTVEYRSFVANLGNLPPAANVLIRMFDGKRTLEQAVADSGIDETTALELVPLLIDAEVLQPEAAFADEVAAYVSARDAVAAPKPSAAAAPSTSSAPAPDPAAAEQARLEAEARAAEEAARQAAEAAQRAADEARRRAEEARRRAEEERRRREEEERRLTLAEIEALDSEQARIQAERQAELDAAREEAERVLREAESRAASLEADARRKSGSFSERERSLADKRRTLTEKLQAIGAAAPPAPRPVIPEPATEAIADARERERRAMERDAAGGTVGMSPAVAGGFGAAERSAPAPTQAGYPSPEASGFGTPATPAYTEPPSAQLPAPSPAPGGALEDSFFKDSQFFTKPGATDDDELFAEPAREGVPPVVWAIGAVLLLGLLVFLLSGGERTEEPVEPTPVAEAPPEEGSEPEEPAEPAGPTEEELAAQALAEAEEAARRVAGDQASDVHFEAQDVADSIIPPETEPVLAATTPPRDRAPRAERPAREERPARDPAPARGDSDAEEALSSCANYSSSGDYGATISACQEAVRLNPRSSDAYTYLGKANYEVGNVDEAINYLGRAVSINGRNRNALLALGAARQDAGDNAGAREAYERYLEINPDSRHAAEVRSILETL